MMNGFSGIYHHLCDASHVNTTCHDQDIALERMLSVSGSGLNFVILIVGILCEAIGSRTVVAIGVFIKIAGNHLRYIDI
jgi:hypothetical protein